MTFVAFLIWVLIVAGTGYMLWKLVFEGRVCKKEEPEPMAVKTEQSDSESTEEGQPEEFTSDVAGGPEEASEDEEKSPEEGEVLEGEVVEEEAVEEEEKSAAEEETEEPEKEK
ncbi:MAG: hypothetical protein JXK94_01810 [Deltaproteobacteria bacterium]|nr:hypothetical protein [Deltaproteobacteria bacterium]